jgi:hypothetical protein
MFKKLLTGLLVMSLTLSGVRPVNAAAAQRESAAPKSAMTLLAETMRTQLGKSLLSDVHSAQTATTAVPSAAVPTPALKPLVLARVQSAYTPSGLVSGTLTITYTAINRLPLDELTGVEIRVKLAPGVSLVSGPAHLTLPDGSLSFALGTLGPSDGASLAIVVQAPAAVGMIDEGARASASFVNKRVSAQTAPARLVADAFAPYLGQQPEFMFNDVDLLEVAGLVEQDPAQAFALVRDATHWEAYRGSLRGARGTWWSEAGNSLDRSSLLLGVLRTIGVPSRYVRGGLSSTRQRELIGQMFLNDTSQIGYVPPEDRYDPYSDTKLLQAAGEHWWVEADLGSGWQALDANFKGAAIGQVFGAGGTPMTVIPDAERHWTKIALTVEHLPALTGPAGKLETFKAFELTLPTAQIAGLPTVIGHFVRSTSDGGAVFYNIRHYYKPFVAVGGAQSNAVIYEGQEYLEQITNFPLGSQRVTAASFDVTVYGPDVLAQTYRDEIVDRIGKLARREGGTVNSAGLSSTQPIVQDRQGVSLLVAPNWVPERARNRAAGLVQSQVARTQKAKERFDAATASTGGQIENEWQNSLALQLTSELMVLEFSTSSLVGLQTLLDTDKQVRRQSLAARVATYPVTPRLLATNFSHITSTNEFKVRSSSNFMQTQLTHVPYPGQSRHAEYGMRMSSSVNSLMNEYFVQQTVLGAISTAAVSSTQMASSTTASKSFVTVMAAAAEQGIEVETIAPEQADKVRKLAVSSDAKALLLEALEDRQRIVMVPITTPIVGGEPYLAWLEIDPQTGLIMDRDENNKHIALMEYGTKTYKNFKDQWFYALAGFVVGLFMGICIRVVIALVTDFAPCQPPSSASSSPPSLPPDAPEGTAEVVAWIESFASEESDRYLYEMCKHDQTALKELISAIITIALGMAVRYLGESFGILKKDNWKAFFVGLSVHDSLKDDRLKMFKNYEKLKASALALTILKQSPGAIAAIFMWVVSSLFSRTWFRATGDSDYAIAANRIMSGFLGYGLAIFNLEISDNFAEYYKRGWLQGGVSFGLNFASALAGVCKAFVGLNRKLWVPSPLCPKPGPDLGSGPGGGSGGSSGGGSTGGAYGGPVPITPRGVSVGTVSSSSGSGVGRRVVITATSSVDSAVRKVIRTEHVRFEEAQVSFKEAIHGVVRSGRIRSSSAIVRNKQTGDIVYSGAISVALPSEGANLVFGPSATLTTTADLLSLSVEGDHLKAQAQFTSAQQISLTSPISITLLVSDALAFLGDILANEYLIEFSEGVIFGLEQLQVLIGSLTLESAKTVNVGSYVEEPAGLFGALSVSSGGSSTAAGGMSIDTFVGRMHLSPLGGSQIRVDADGNSNWVGIADLTWSDQAELGGDMALGLRVSEQKPYTVSLSMSDNWRHDWSRSENKFEAGRHPRAISVLNESASAAILDAQGRSVLVADASVNSPALTRAVDISVGKAEPLAYSWGRMQPSSARGMDYAIGLMYRGAQSETFNISVDGLPAPWVVLPRTQIRFATGGLSLLNLTISPTVDDFPAPGTVIPFTVTARSLDNALVASAATSWTVPLEGIPALQVYYFRSDVSSTDIFTVPLLVGNNGLVTDSFPISGVIGLRDRLITLPPSITVGPQSAVVVPARVEINNYPVGKRQTMYFRVRELVAAADFWVHPDEVMPLFHWAYDNAGEDCIGDLATRIYALAWHQSAYLLDGDRRELAAIREIVNSLPQQLGCLSEIGVFTGTQAISSALTLVPTNTQPLVDALELLSDQVERALDYRATLSIAPALSVVRTGQPVALPVVLAHTGRVSGTFTLTVTDTDGVAQTFTPTLAPGERFTHTVVFTPSVEGTYAVTATASTPDPQVRPRAGATVLAYERLTDILVVRGAPDFVETGNSSSALSVDVVNHTPLPQAVTIHLTMTTPSGGVYYTTQVTRTLLRGVTNIPLGTVPFVNAPAGVYALEARLVEENRVARGGVNAGTGVRVATSSRPLIVPPGDVEATTWITTERTVYGSGGTFEVGVPISGGVDLTITLDAAQHSGTNPAVGVAVTVPAGIYDAVYITGAVRWHDGGQWYGQVDILDTLNNKYYMLGHGLNTALGSSDSFVGGLPTMEAGGAYHAGRFIRLRITDTTTLRFYIYDTDISGSSANTGTIIVRLTQVDYPDNTLRRRMETAMHHSVPRHALDVVQWQVWTGASTGAYPVPTANNDCYGCHIQTQGIAGLEAVRSKVRPSPVDTRMIEWLNQGMKRRLVDGVVWKARGERYRGDEYGQWKIQTMLAAWAWAEQSKVERAITGGNSVTLTNLITESLYWLIQPAYRDNNVWKADHSGAPYWNFNSRCGGGFEFSPFGTFGVIVAVVEAFRLTGNDTYRQVANSAVSSLLTVNWRGTCSGGDPYPGYAANVMLALQEALPILEEPLATQVRAAIAAFENDLRTWQQITPGTTHNDGGWRWHLPMGPGYPSDPLATAMALYALARQGVRSTDVNLVRATEFLLANQDRLGRWHSIYFSTRIIPTTWVDFALPLVYEAIGSYSMDVLHDTPANVDVIDSSFNLAPQSVVTLPAGERRAWFYNQPETMRYQVISYTSALTGLRPGEVRPLTLGTLVTYTIESGSNQIALPGAYVQAVKLVSVAPAQQTIGVGQTARYTVTLRNPLDQPVVYAVAVSGLDAYGADQTFSMNVPANGQVERVIEVSAPEWMQPRQDAFWVTVNGGQDSDVAALRVVRETALRLLPASQRALPGRTVTYTAVVSDLSGAGSIVDVAGQLGGGSAVTLANGLSVPANGERIVTWTLTAPSTPGTYGLRAHALGGLNVPEASAQLEVVAPALSAALGSATVGAGMPAVLTSTLRQDAPAGVEPTLPGALVSVQAPAGWQVVQAPTHLPAGRLAGHGDVIVVPPAGTAPGTYNVMMTAVMTGYPQVTAQAVGRVTVLNNGLVVSVRPTTQTVTTGDAFEFEVLVINTGTAADQVVVSATGMLASHSTLVWDTGSGVVAANRVSLAPGQSARFVLAGQAANALVGGVHPAAVMARSLSRPEVQAVDYGWLIVNGRPDLRLTITPTYQLVETPNAGAWLHLDNAGSAAADPVVLTVATEGGAAAYAPVSPAPMVLPQWQGALPLSAWLPRPGRYVVTATASTPGMAGFAVATATVEYRMAAALRVAGVETWPGQSATLPFTLTNLGQQTMNDLSVRLSVPQGPWSLNGISAQNGPLTLTLPGGPVTPGENGRSYQVLPFAPLPYGAERITVTAELLLNGEVWQVEQAQVRVRAPDFRTSSLTVAGSQLFVHDILTYTWRLRNTGDADAIGAQAVVTLPADARFEFQGVLSVSGGTATWDGVAKRLTWQGDLPVGGEVVVTFLAQASFGLPQGTLNSPFEVSHPWRPTHFGTAQYDYPYRVYFMIVRRNAP